MLRPIFLLRWEKVPEKERELIMDFDDEEVEEAAQTHMKKFCLHCRREVPSGPNLRSSFSKTFGLPWDRSDLPCFWPGSGRESLGGAQADGMV